MDSTGRVDPDGLDLTVWAKRTAQERDRTMSPTEFPIWKDSDRQMWVVRWRPDLATAPWNRLRLILQPADAGDIGFPIRGGKEAGRRKFLEIETGLL